VISRNYSKKPDTNFSPKEGTEHRDEFNVSFFKFLMSFSVLSVVWWWIWGTMHPQLYGSFPGKLFYTILPDPQKFTQNELVVLPHQRRSTFDLAGGL
jgi:hypothetical protein